MRDDKMTRARVCVCARAYACTAAPHLDPGSLSFTGGEVTRRLHLRRSTKQANSSDLFTSEIAVALVALPSHPRDNATRPCDPTHFRLADEMAQQQRWHARDPHGYYNAP